MSGTKREGAITIPELESLAKEYQPRNRFWTDAEIETLRAYYGRVEPRALAEHLGRSAESVRNKARALRANGEM